MSKAMFNFTFSNLSFFLSKTDTVDIEILKNNKLILNDLEEIIKLLTASSNSSLYESIAFTTLGALLGFLLPLFYQYFIRKKKENYINSTCSSYEGIYLAFEKRDQENKPKYYFELTRIGDMFKINDGMALIGIGDFSAEITMNEPTYKRGSGFYQHKKDPDGVTRFGFIDIQLANKEILVHTTIHNNGKNSSDAYRWIKQDFSKKVEFDEKYRLLQQKNKIEKFKTLKH